MATNPTAADKVAVYAAMVQQWPRLKDREARVLMALAGATVETDLAGSVASKDLARRTGLHIVTVAKACAGLAVKGFVRRRHRIGRATHFSLALEAPIRVRTRLRPPRQRSELRFAGESTADLLRRIAMERTLATLAAEQDAAEDAYAAEGYLIQQRQDAIDAKRARELRSNVAPGVRPRRRCLNL